MENSKIQVAKVIKYWWVGIILGLLFLILGIWVLRTPIKAFSALSLLFAITYLISGIGSITFALSNRSLLQGWAWRFTGGILEILLGIILLSNSVLSIMVLSFFIGFWLLFRGIWSISAALELKQFKAKDWGWVLISGMMATLFAFGVMLNPLFAASFLSIITGATLIVLATVHILIAFQFRKVVESLKSVE